MLLCELVERLSAGETIVNTIDTLEVHFWETQHWFDPHRNALINLCHRYKIKTLIYSIKDAPRNVRKLFFTRLKSLAQPEVPFLCHLKTIVIDFSLHNVRPHSNIFVGSRLVSINWRFLDEHSRSVGARRVFEEFNNRGSHNEFRLLNITFSFWRLGLWCRRVPIERDGNFLCEEKHDVLFMLERNQAAFQKCQKATLAILALMRRKEFIKSHSLSRDTLGIVAVLVFQTRGTRVWIG
jgi:hypothetical protein